MHILRKKDWSVRNQFQFSLRLWYNLNKIHSFFWICPTLGKIIISCFSTMEMEEYMKLDLFVIFRVKLVTNPRGHNAGLSLRRDVSFWRNIKMLLTMLLDFSYFLV